MYFIYHRTGKQRCPGSNSKDGLLHDCDTIVVQLSRDMKGCKDSSDHCAVAVNSLVVDSASIKALVGGVPAISAKVTHVEGISVLCSSID